MAEEELRDVLLQAAILLMITAAFFLLVVNKTDTTMLYLRYYAKDLGTQTEALYAAKGDVNYAYAELHPKQQYLFNFTDGRLFLSAQQNLTVPVIWAVGQGYGATVGGVNLAPAFLVQPAIITFQKSGNTIQFAQSEQACADAYGSMLKIDTRIVLDVPPDLKTLLEQDSQLLALEKNGMATRTITIALKEGDASLQYGSAADPQAAQRLACLLASHLQSSYQPLQEQPIAQPTDQPEIALTLPAFKGAEETSVAKAVILAVDEAIR